MPASETPPASLTTDAIVTPAPGKPTEHVAVMDGLRGLAIALVVLFHYWLLSFYVIPLPGTKTHNLEFIQFAGFLGVELFFFISAFCLYYPIASGKQFAVGHFFYRRAIKIIPSYLLVLVVFAFFVPSLYPSTWEHGKFADLGLHLLFLHNFSVPTHGSFNGVLWSLAVEVQFYLLFPFIAWVFKRRPFITFALMVGGAIAYRAWIRGGTEDHFKFWTDFLPSFIDLFAFGMLAAWVMVWIRQRPKTAAKLKLPITVAALLSFVLVLIVFRWAYDVRFDRPIAYWQSENRAYIGALFMSLAVASAFALPAWRAVLSNRVLVFLSTISYNLYLWHQGVGLFIRNEGIWPADTDPPTDDPTWRLPYMLFGIVMSIVVAALITYLFERPLLRDGVRGTAQRVRARLPGGHTDGGDGTDGGAPAEATPAVAGS
ncbi:MAG: acyltransferase [Solirubrobacteraceae bacterium]|nr:acyltransferase [Solirubrobacteraceae bacterium]